MAHRLRCVNVCARACVCEREGNVGLTLSIAFGRKPAQGLVARACTSAQTPLHTLFMRMAASGMQA